MAQKLTAAFRPSLCLAALFRHRQSSVPTHLEAELQCKLDLPWVIDSTRRSIQGRRSVGKIRSSFKISRRTVAPESCRVEGTEVCGAIDGIEIPDIERIEEIEAFRDDFEASFLME